MLFSNMSLLRKRPKKSKKRKKNLKWRYPAKIEREYLALLSTYVESWKSKMIELIFPAIPDLVAQANIARPEGAADIKTDSWVDELGELMREYGLQITLDQNRLEFLVSTIGQNVNNFNQDEWFKITNNIFGVPLVQVEPWVSDTINGFTTENTALVTSLNQQTVREIETTINRGIKQGLRSSTIRQHLLDGTELTAGVFKKVENRAQLIARDQVAKLNGQLTQLRQTSAGITQYIWTDSDDERVRKKHSNMDGRYCSWANASIYSNDGEKWFNRSSIGGVELHPGQDYQCRCWADPVFESIENVQL